MEEVLGEESHGVRSSDFHGAYDVYRGPHQCFGMRLLRDPHTLKEQHPDDETVQSWAKAVRGLSDSAQAFLKAGPPSQSEWEQRDVVLRSGVRRAARRARPWSASLAPGRSAA